METFFVTKVSILFFTFYHNCIFLPYCFAPLKKTRFHFHYLCYQTIVLMDTGEKNSGKQMTFKKIFRYFIQGIIILAPIGITAYVMYWLFDQIDGILRPYAEYSRAWVSDYNCFHYPGGVGQFIFFSG